MIDANNRYKTIKKDTKEKENILFVNNAFTFPFHILTQKRHEVDLQETEKRRYDILHSH